MTKASTIFQKINFSQNYHLNALESKFDLDVNVLVGPTSPMLHTKSRGHRPSGSGEEDFERVFTIYGRGGHLGHVTRPI